MKMIKGNFQKHLLRLIAENNTDITDFTKGILTLVDVDFSEYRRKIDQKSVRKNVTLPSWLNWEAEQAGLNVSRVLQEALMENWVYHDSMNVLPLDKNIKIGLFRRVTYA